MTKKPYYIVMQRDGGFDTEKAAVEWASRHVGDCTRLTVFKAVASVQRDVPVPPPVKITRYR